MVLLNSLNGNFSDSRQFELDQQQATKKLGTKQQPIERLTKLFCQLGHSILFSTFIENSRLKWSN